MEQKKEKGLPIRSPLSWYNLAGTCIFQQSYLLYYLLFRSFFQSTGQHTCVAGTDYFHTLIAGLITSFINAKITGTNYRLNKESNEEVSQGDFEQHLGSEQ